MEQIKINRNTLSAIADAVRAKSKRNIPMRPKDMTAEIANIPVADRQARFSQWAGSAIRTLKFPEGITEIPKYRFYGFSDLAITKLPDTVTSIGEYAFSDCTNLALKKLPPGLETISASVFNYCTALQLKEIPYGTKTIESHAFYRCTNLDFKKIPNTVTLIDDRAFCLCNFTVITFLGKPENVSATAFLSCHNLKSINVPWSEGEVANAPWGAVNATINYNYKEEANGNQDTVSL